MNAFVRYVAYGLAALFLLLVACILTVLTVLRANPAFSPQALRALVLSPEERAYLDRMRTRKDEPSEQVAMPSAISGGATEEELLARIADMANAQHATQLVAKLRRQQDDLDERQAYLEQQWADLQLAKAGVERTKQEIADAARKDAELARQQEAERARWAAAQVAEAQQLQVMGEVEKARYRDQAKLFEQMKDAAWQSLRRMEPREIARYLSLMDVKKAARVMILAQQDTENPTLCQQIHQEMLHIDLDRASGDQVDRLAQLYSFMPADQVLAYCKDASVQEMADILQAMAKTGQVKKRAEIMEALRMQDSQREMDVRHLLEQAPKDAAP
jgi:hypothetical protein